MVNGKRKRKTFVFIKFGVVNFWIQKAYFTFVIIGPINKIKLNISSYLSSQAQLLQDSWTAAPRPNLSWSVSLRGFPLVPFLAVLAATLSLLFWPPSCLTLTFPTSGFNGMTSATVPEHSRLNRPLFHRCPFLGELLRQGLRFLIHETKINSGGFFMTKINRTQRVYFVIKHNLCLVHSMSSKPQVNYLMCYCCYSYVQVSKDPGKREATWNNTYGLGTQLNIRVLGSMHRASSSSPTTAKSNKTQHKKKGIWQTWDMNTCSHSFSYYT